MRRLPFQYWRDGEVFWARYVREGNPPVREHWPGLNDSDAMDDIEAAHWHRYAVNNNNREEVAAYLRLVWTLLSDREVLGHPYFESDAASEVLSQVGSPVRWQFETDAEGPPGHAVIKGFTPARSSVRIRPPPTDRQRWLRDKALLFRVGSFAESSALLRVVLSDAAGEVSLFGTTEGGAHRIVDVLRAPQQPSMSQVLAGDDIFVDLGIGVDLGYNDYLFVASRSPVAPLLESAVEETERAILEYEQRISVYTSPADFLALLGRLAGH